MPPARGPGDRGLVAWTSGNVSARVRDGDGGSGPDLMVIKPSGISYDDLTPESMVVCDLDGNRSRASYRRPATPPPTPTCTGTCRRSAAWCTPTRTYATAWAARGEAIPCVLTAMADEFGGEIPVGPFALIGGDEIGRGIVATLAGHRSPPC